MLGQAIIKFNIKHKQLFLSLLFLKSEQGCINLPIVHPCYYFKMLCENLLITCLGRRTIFKLFQFVLELIEKPLRVTIFFYGIFDFLDGFV